jgi:hypothetical protein
MLVYKVNGFHIRSHNPGCSDEYGLSNTPLVGNRAMEEVETGWSVMNRDAMSTREMHAGKRTDMLQTHMHHINESKIENMRECQNAF